VQQHADGVHNETMSVRVDGYDVDAADNCVLDSNTATMASLNPDDIPEEPPSHEGCNGSDVSEQPATAAADADDI